MQSISMRKLVSTHFASAHIAHSSRAQLFCVAPISLLYFACVQNKNIEIKDKENIINICLSRLVLF